MNINNLDLNLLRAFDALMREQNVSRAAQRISLSQPAMSNALNRLRELLDDPVLVRVGRGMQPTQKARAMELPIRSALKMIENSLIPEADFDAAHSDRVFRILATDYVQLLLLPALLELLQQQAPGVRIEVSHLDPDVPELQLEQGEFDFAIGRFPQLPQRLSRMWLFSDDLRCLVAANNPAFGDEVTEQQFLQTPQIWVSGGQRRGLIDEWLAKQGKQRQVSVVTPSFLLAPLLVSASDTLVVTPARVAQQYARYLPLKILPLPMPIPAFDIHLIWHPCQAETSSHRWLRDTLSQLCASMS
ncbi:LysR family transcriptional regulator [Bacterioplanoides sp.]|uniref:LysR family transcriptional regulator n=1 Tax=Bacterioplanoides sp. TaxID=2066072 RepID=UPI003B58DDC7